MIYKPVRIADDVGLLLALQRVRDGRVFLRGAELGTEKGRPFPRVLTRFVHELFEHGHARVGNPEDTDLEQQALITPLGEAFLMELEATIAFAVNRSSTVDDPQ